MMGLTTDKISAGASRGVARANKATRQRRHALVPVLAQRAVSGCSSARAPGGARRLFEPFLRYVRYELRPRGGRVGFP